MIIAVKPWLVSQIISGIKETLDYKNQIVISIAAGVSIEDLQNLLDKNGEKPVIFRIIPNTAIDVLQSVSTIASCGASKEQEAEVLEIFGELGKAIVIDDGSGGIELKIEGEDINSVVPLFSRVMLRCSGLNLGREGAKTVMGRAPTAEYVVDRIDMDDLLNYLTLVDCNTVPESERLTISAIDSHKMLHYVTLSNLQLVDNEQEMTWCDVDPQNRQEHLTTIRHFHDLCDTLRVVVDGACHYAGEKLPTHPCSLHGIVDWHNGDIALRISAYQLVEQQ